MKRDFDKASRIEKPASIVQHAPVFVAKPAPAPSPSGDVPRPAARELRHVPVKTPEAALKRLVEVKKEFSLAAAKPAPDLKKDCSAGVADNSQGLKRLPQQRTRDRDREPD